MFNKSAPKEQTPPTRQLPKHLAVIMDGNGRWAKERGLSRTSGHSEGGRRLDEIVSECRAIGIKYLTIYAFSTENWSRPNHEVSVLMHLMVQYLKTMDKKLVNQNISFLAQGTLDRLPRLVQSELRRVIALTNYENPDMYLNVSLSYGGRQEIVDATRAIAEKVKAGTIDPKTIDENTIRQHLYQPNVPDPDLLIRTGGDWRVSNFLLWEIAYTELFVTNTLWPDFHISKLHEALELYGNRERRYGMTSEQVGCLSPEQPGITL